MCLAVPGRIMFIDKSWAEVDIMGIISSVNLQLIDDPAIDDYVLIHAGCAIQKISTADSLYFQSLIKELMV